MHPHIINKKYFLLNYLGLDRISHLEGELTVLLVEREHPEIVVAGEDGEPPGEGVHRWRHSPPVVSQLVLPSWVSRLLKREVIVVWQPIW